MESNDDDLLIGLGDDGEFDENEDEYDGMMEYNETTSSNGPSVGGRNRVNMDKSSHDGDMESKGSHLTKHDDYDSDLSDEDFGTRSRASKSNKKSTARGLTNDDDDAEEKLLEAQEYKLRLFRRTMILEEVRKSYLKDVILLKQVMLEMFNDEDRMAVMAQYESMIPSLDMKQWFQPRAPELTTFQVRPCDLCGGHLEITINVSEELKELRLQIENQKKVEERMRLDYATQSYNFEKLQVDKDYQDRTHAQEKSVLYGEMKRLKSEIDTTNDTGILHKRQMQQMKSSIAEHEKTKLKLRAAEMRADDSIDELKSLRLRSHELEERVQTLENDSVYDKVVADLEKMKDDQEAGEQAKVDMQLQVEAAQRELAELVAYQDKMKEHIGALEGQVAAADERVVAKQGEMEAFEKEFKQYQTDVAVELDELEDKVGGVGCVSALTAD